MVYRRLAVTIVADMNVITAEITVINSTSHPSLCPYRVSQNTYGVKTYHVYNRRRAINNNNGPTRRGAGPLSSSLALRRDHFPTPRPRPFVCAHVMRTWTCACAILRANTISRYSREAATGCNKCVAASPRPPCNRPQQQALRRMEYDYQHNGIYTYIQCRRK